MKSLLVILLIPSILLSMGCASYPEIMAKDHPNWPKETQDALLNLRTWNGMTVDEFECYLWLWGATYVNPHLFHPHWHATPSSITANGEYEMRSYKLYKMTSGSSGWMTVMFKDGRLQDRTTTTLTR